MREIIAKLEWARNRHENGPNIHSLETAYNIVAVIEVHGEAILTALRAGQALADAWRGLDLDPRTETFWKYTDARDAVLAAFPGEETTG